jgi:hypothetical protein
MSVKLRNIRNSSGSNSDAYTPPYKFGDYFMTILQLLVAFILFCWTTTTNYLNGLHIDTDKTYPLTINGVTNPYATAFNPGTIDTSNQADVSKKVWISWWWECTQQSSYHFFGSILHRVFNFFKFMINNDDPVAALFSVSFLKWIGFGLLSNITMLALFCIVFFIWIPGWFGGLTAFLPTTYYTASGFLKACKVLIVLFLSFWLMVFLGGVTIIPVIWQFFNLIYITWFKQIFDDPSRFGNEFMKRMKQLVLLYVIVSIVVGFAYSELPNETKITVAVISAIPLFFAFYKMGTLP